jgi:TonB family protein
MRFTTLGKTKLSLFFIAYLFIFGQTIIGKEVKAEESHSSKNSKSFQLNATYEELPKLSRQEIIETENNVSTNPRQVAFLSTNEARPNKTVNPDMLIFQREEIDWSNWIGVLADRWFYVLRNKERTLGIQFYTQGPALIQFTCYPNGEIGNISLRQSSGVEEYDRMQVEALMEITPLPPFPSGTRRTSLTLRQGWESHKKRPGELDYQPGSFGKQYPMEYSGKWVTWQ